MDNTIIFEGPNKFEVPTEIVDEHLSAPDTELRLILFLLRHQNKSFTKEDIIKALHAEELRIDTAFEYWLNAGILCKTGSKYLLERPKISALEVMKYTPSQIAQRIDNDPAIKFLSQQAQAELAKPLTEADASLLISIVDWYGIHPDAAALMIHYCAESGASSMAKIQKTAAQWAEKGICTYEAATEFLEQQQKRSAALNKVSALLGFTHRKLTDAEEKAFLTWREEYLFDSDIIKLAYDKTVNSTGKYSLAYMNKILTSWHDKNLTTLSEIENADRSTEKPSYKRSVKKRYEPKIKMDIEGSLKDSWAIIEAELKKD